MSMITALNNMIYSISQNVPKAENEYIGDDGLLHCAVCHKKTQTIVEFEGEKRTVRCICDCKQKEMEAYKQAEIQAENERMRRRCFAETNMAEWTFANDDGKNPKISNAMKRYSDDFRDFKEEGRGLLLYGSVGTGKTYYAACIANALIDIGYSVFMTNFATALLMRRTIGA